MLLETIVEGRKDVEASEVLGGLADRSVPSAEIVRSVLRALDASSDPRTRLRLTQTLAEIPGDAAHDALLALTADRDRTVAATAAVALTTRRGARRA